MAYRGEDLDLRLPQQRGARETYVPTEFGLNGTRPRSPLPSGGREPVVIDDTVMACCNHAYDIAQAHGASEVRLEHLVHALTRVEAAAEILEERGIREAHLRRESAAVIASEIPVGLAHSQSAPRASAEFEDVLRRASDQAAAQPGNRGATVHDLLWVLLNYNREIPAIALLLRHAAGWQSWDWPNRSSLREPARDELVRRREPARAAVAPRAPDRVERRPAPRPAASYASVDARERILPTDALQARLDQMDQAIRALHAETSSDRRALTDLIRDLQRDVQDSRSAGSNGDAGVMIEQLRAVEANVEDRLEHLARTATALTDRLQALEGTVSGSLQEGSRSWMAVGDRLKSLDKAVSNNSTAGLADLVTEQLVTVTEQVRQATLRLETLERTMEQRQTDGQRTMSALGERLRSLDENLAAQRREQQMALANQNPAALADRFAALKSQLDQNRADLTTTLMQHVEPLAQRLQQVDAASDRRQAESLQLMQNLAQRVTGSEPILNGLMQRATAAEPLLNALVKRAADSEPAMQAIGQRVAGFEASLKAHADANRSDLVEVHDALVKLGTNQQTLASNLEQWRVESGGDLGIISNRLELLERGSAQPIQMLAQLQADMQGVQQVALADYDHNRRGFMHWMFGTDDVFASSWNDETAAVRARLKQLKEASGRKA